MGLAVSFFARLARCDGAFAHGRWFERRETGGSVVSSLDPRIFLLFPRLSRRDPDGVLRSCLFF